MVTLVRTADVQHYPCQRVCEIPNAVVISSKRVHNILHRHFNMKKLFSRQMP